MDARSDTLVFVPAWNEEENLPAALDELRKDLPQADVLVVDDGSESSARLRHHTRGGQASRPSWKRQGGLLDLDVVSLDDARIGVVDTAGQRDNAPVVEQFVDRGESARSSRRPELQRMLTYLAENQVDYVIIHKIDRLARNRVDDVEINLALRKAGATLVSCTENIDETTSGHLLHGIMSSIAEFYSRNLASEVNKGLIQKARNGGTPSRAPLGYVNVRKFDNGREIRTVEVDPERAPLVIWAFKTYATGEWTVRTLLAEVTKRGLLSKPTPKRPARPISVSAFNGMLKNPYYIGIVRYRGIDHPGRHEPLIDKQTFDEVQRLLEAHNFAGEKQRVHHHYFKGSIFWAKRTTTAPSAGRA